MKSNDLNHIKPTHTALAAGIASMLLLQPSVRAAGNDDAVMVTVDNFVRAETSVNYHKTLALVNGEINTIFHFREPMPLSTPPGNHRRDLEFPGCETGTIILFNR